MSVPGEANKGRLTRGDKGAMARSMGRGPPSGTISEAELTKGPLIRKDLGAFSVFCRVRSELLRPILGLLDPARYLRMCF